MSPTHSPKQTGWEISEVRTVDGEFMVCGGEGHSFGLIATVTREEDAHLIAAAPELYEALEDLLESYKAVADSGEHVFWRVEDTEEGQKALYALSKARPSNRGEA